MKLVLNYECNNNDTFGVKCDKSPGTGISFLFSHKESRFLTVVQTFLNHLEHNPINRFFSIEFDVSFLDSRLEILAIRCPLLYAPLCHAWWPDLALGAKAVSLE